MGRTDTNPSGKEPTTRSAGRAAATGVGLAAALIGGVAVAGAGLAGRSAARRSREHAVTAPDKVHVFPFEADKVLAVPANDGVVLHVEVDEPQGWAGSGRPTVVLVHGFVLNLSSWTHQRRELVDAGYRVVSYDQRNHGRSEHGDLAACTIDQLGKDLRAVVDATSPEGDLVLVGHSMGGMTIMSFAGRYQRLTRDRVVGAALLATSAGGDSLVQLGLGQRFDRIIAALGPGVLGNLSNRDGLWGSARAAGRGVESWAVQKYAFGSQMPKDLLRQVATMVFGTRLDTIGAFLPELDTLDIREALPALVETPVLIVAGSRDILTPPAHSDRLAEALPAAELIVVPGVGHVLQLERPGAVTDAIFGLLERPHGQDAERDAQRAKGAVREESA
ncbi:alpha/beta fold hydrolase [Janibacter cremeus]|uniref:Pimeloyl-ACP methyl ester carboxylesterase n=1 Tax=Janibacter cremeus TaxID=1285192 RepID=A0A852VPJ2_9MICO|nr:alpha/beta hydrolase [Janibacter cremeus]NYF98947.1 pimeloyl-ACP methyl ester carboxylesterase [Janibacter cremeus]